MTLSFYLDDDSEAIALTHALQRADIVVLRATASGNRGLPDGDHLEFAAGMGLTLVSANRGDFMQLHWQWLAAERKHFGIAISNQHLSVGDQLRALLALNRVFDRDSIVNQLVFLNQWVAR